MSDVTVHEGVGGMVGKLRCAVVVLATMLAGVLTLGSGCVSSPDAPGAPSSRPEVTASPGTTAPMEPGRSAAPPFKVCVQDVVDKDVEWVPLETELVDGDLEVRYEKGELFVTERDHRWTVFEDRVASVAASDDVFVGSRMLNESWLVFGTADDIQYGAPWRLHAWDRRHPDEPAWVIGEQGPEIEQVGFPLPQLRGDHVVWSQDVEGDVRAVFSYDLASRELQELARGSVYAPVFLDDDVVLWQSEPLTGKKGIEGVNLATGQAWEGSNPIADMDPRGGQFATDGTYWVLVNVPDGEDPEEDAQLGEIEDDREYVTWVWREGWPEAVELLRLEQRVYVAPDGQYGAVVDGYLQFIAYGAGAHIADLGTGYVYRLWPEWALMEVRDGKVWMGRHDDAADASVEASVSLRDLVPNGPCGKPIVE